MSTEKKRDVAKTTKSTTRATTKSATSATTAKKAAATKATKAAAKPAAATAAKKATPAKSVAAQPAKKEPIAVHVTHEAIAQRAWEIWQREGCPEGREVDHWIRAEQELRQ